MPTWQGTTVSSVVQDVRVLLQDLNALSYRYTESELYRYVSEGVAVMYRIRPDFMVGQGWTRPFYTEADASELLPDAVGEFYATPLAEWVAGMAELRDDQFSQDGRAIALLQKMRAALLAPGM